MLSILNIVIMFIGAIFLLVWLYFFFVGNKHSSLFDALAENDYPLKEIYGLGYAIMEAINYQYKTKADRKLRQEVDVLYGKKYADYYIRVIYSQKVSISLSVFILSFIIYGLTAEIFGLFIGLMFSAVAFYYFGTITSKKILSRSDELLSDFSEVVSKLALLTNAGMILKEAWEEVAYAGETTIYKEMQNCIVEINNGVSDIDAYHAFGIKCIIPEVKKFVSTIIQGITKGNSELAMMLQEQSKEVWAAKKQHVRRQGEKAGNKLLIPISIMFIGILIMILVPIFTNLGI